VTAPTKKTKLAAAQMTATYSLPMVAYCKVSVLFCTKLTATACSCTVPPNKWIRQIIDNAMLDKSSAVETDSMIHAEDMDSNGQVPDDEENMYFLL
jgi:hypothetical protein